MEMRGMDKSCVSSSGTTTEKSSLPVGARIWLLAALAATGLAGQRCLCWFPEPHQYEHNVCGDSIAEGDEECDLIDLRDETCFDLGYEGGMLRCSFDCHFDESNCVLCGDGIAQYPEVCDTGTWLSTDCERLGYQAGGTLLCNATCDGYDTSQCDQSQYCGNNIREGYEACDGTDLGGESCESLNHVAGELLCDECYALDESECTGTPDCGNGMAEGQELCDGDDIRGADCASVGFTGGGHIGCGQNCQMLDPTGCLDGCGNGRLELAESCDGTDFGGLTCQDFGYSAGALVCTRDCAEILVGGCGTWANLCGNGHLDPGEACDGTLLGPCGECSSHCFSGGTLTCDPWCRFDFRGCMGDACADMDFYTNGTCEVCELLGGHPDPDCALCPVADGVCRSYLAFFLGVSSCVFETGAEDPDCGRCGDGIHQTALEACDGSDFQWTCADFGYQAGDPAGCDASCVPDLTSCIPHVCGDGILCPSWQGACHEECDDGNLITGDGCDATCHLEP